MPLLPGRGGTCRPRPPGKGTNKSGMGPEIKGGPPAPCLAPGRRSLPTSRKGERPPPSRCSWLPSPLPRAARRAPTDLRGLVLRLSWTREVGPLTPERRRPGGGSDELPVVPGERHAASCARRALLPLAWWVLGAGHWKCPVLRGSLPGPPLGPRLCAGASAGCGSWDFLGGPA